MNKNNFFNKEEFIKKSYYNIYLKEYATLPKETEAYIYVRVSTTGQLEKSPDAQLEDILKYCINNKIWVAKENIFIDGGISGRHADNRLEFQKMINSATSKKNACKLILIHKYDRFARNKEESVIYKAKLKKHGIKVVSINEPLPNDKKMALIIESNLELTSEMYSINLSDEVYKGLTINANDGVHQTRAPYGYQKVIKEVIKYKNRDKIIRQMIIKEDEAEIVKIIFEKYLNGESEFAIAKYLNNLKIPTKEGTFKWYDFRVRYILTNITYTGYTHWTKKGEETTIKKSNFPIIINKEDFDKVQKIIKLHIFDEEKKRLRTQVNNDHWLRGKVRCAYCNDVLCISGKSWQCTGYTHGSCLKSNSILIKKLENLVLDYLKELSDKKININIENIKISNNDEIAILNNQLNQLTNKTKKIMDAYETGIYSLEEFSERKSYIKLEEEFIKRKIKELEERQDIKTVINTIYENCLNLYELLRDENVPIIDKKIALNEIIDKIIFNNTNKELQIFYK